jgi:hypothetical protein
MGIISMVLSSFKKGIKVEDMYISSDDLGSNNITIPVYVVTKVNKADGTILVKNINSKYNDKIITLPFSDYNEIKDNISNSKSKMSHILNIVKANRRVKRLFGKETPCRVEINANGFVIANNKLGFNRNNWKFMYSSSKEETAGVRAKSNMTFIITGIVGRSGMKVNVNDINANLIGEQVYFFTFKDGTSNMLLPL